ncbi:hypothetical protein G6F65_015243 [Rhizopus arrhizus]|nr:hypothetical protein G6F65_015243 [Rhizopus arrhizus]
MRTSVSSRGRDTCGYAYSPTVLHRDIPRGLAPCRSIFTMPTNAAAAAPRVKPRREFPPAARDPPGSTDTDRPACPCRCRRCLVAAAQACRPGGGDHPGQPRRHRADRGGHRRDRCLQAGQRRCAGLGPDQVAEGAAGRHGEGRRPDRRDRRHHPAEPGAQRAGLAGPGHRPARGAAGHPAPGRTGVRAPAADAGRRGHLAPGIRCRRGAAEDRPCPAAVLRGADQGPRNRAGHRPRQPGLYPHHRADGRHRGRGGGRGRPHRQRQPDRTDHRHAGTAGRGHRQCRDLRGRRGQDQGRHAGVLHHAGRPGPQVPRQAPPDQSGAGLDRQRKFVQFQQLVQLQLQQRGLLQRAVRRGESGRHAAHRHDRPGLGAAEAGQGRADGAVGGTGAQAPWR